MARIQALLRRTSRRPSASPGQPGDDPGLESGQEFGACRIDEILAHGGMSAVYRAYNDGFAKGIDSNHRITANKAAYDEQVAKGWKGEGIVMCAPQ